MFAGASEPVWMFAGASEPVWMFAAREKSLTPPGIRNPDCPARSVVAVPTVGNQNCRSPGRDF